MITGTLTTTPERLPYLANTLRSIECQVDVDRVLLLVENSLLSVADKLATDIIEVHEVSDIGPGKKHLGPLFCEPNEIIVTFDDDHIYECDHAKKLVSTVNTGKVAGFVGLTKEYVRVFEGRADWLNGAQGWAYLASWLPTDEVIRLGSNSSCRYSDDIYIGSIFSRKNRQRVVVPESNAYKLPSANVMAWVHSPALRFHSQRDKRDLACLKVAWAHFDGSDKA